MNLFKHLLQLAPRLMITAFLTSLVSGLCSAQLVAMINRGLAGSSGEAIAATFAGYVLLALLARLVSELMLVYLSQRLVAQMRLQLSRRILATPLSQIEQIGQPRLLALLTEDVQAVATAAAYIPSAGIAIAIVIGCLFYLMQLSGRVFAGFVVFLLLAVASYQAVTGLAERFLTRAREEQDRLYFALNALIGGIKELKQHKSRQTAFETEVLGLTISNFQKHSAAGMTVFSFALSWTQLLLFTAIGLVNFVLPQWQSLPPTVISGYTLTMIFLIIPLDALTTILPLLGKAEIALTKISTAQLKLIAQQREDVYSLISPSTEQFFPWQTLTCQNLEYKYARNSRADVSQFEIGPLDLTIHRQELLFLTGGNGSGKSTFAKVLCGLYSHQSGTISLGNQVITDENRAWYRQQFSVVFSDFYLFDRLLGCDRWQERAPKYLAKLRLDDKVDLHRGKFSSLSLSQGQRRRLALLVAYLEDRPIYIFDEWAADQDPDFRTLFYTQLLPELQANGKTIIAITHDDRYFGIADRVVKLDYGKVVDSQREARR